MKCPNCGKTKFAVDRSTGENYCTNCGFVISYILDYSSKSRSRSPTSYSQSGKGLGTRISMSNPFYYKLRRWHATENFSSNEERSFKRALHVLNIVWGKLNVSHDIKEASSLLYRHCIKARITNGRDTYTMVFAVLAMTLERFGINRDVEVVAREFEINEKIQRKYMKAIRRSIRKR